MAQQINLFQSPFRDNKKRFSAQTMLYASAGAFALMLAMSGYSGWQIYALQRTAAAIEKQSQAMSVQKATLEQQITAAHADPDLAAQVQQTEEALNRQQQLRALLKQDLFGKNQGYSRYLVALARQHVPGLWLTDITLSGAGRGLSLKGETVVPELLPDYLQNLSQEDLLHGVNFRVFQLNRVADAKKSKAKSSLSFVVATSEEVGAKP